MQLSYYKLSTVNALHFALLLFILVLGDLSGVSLINGIILYYCNVEGSLRLKHFIAVALIVVNMTHKPS